MVFYRLKLGRRKIAIASGNFKWLHLQTACHANTYVLLNGINLMQYTNALAFDWLSQGLMKWEVEAICRYDI